MTELLLIPVHAEHWYVPAWLRWTSNRVSCCSLVPRTSPVSFRIQLIFGGGFPVALQWRVALCPSMIDAGHSKFRTRGSSIRKKGKLSVIILDINELLGNSITLLSRSAPIGRNCFSGKYPARYGIWESKGLKGVLQRLIQRDVWEVRRPLPLIRPVSFSTKVLHWRDEILLLIWYNFF